MITLTNCVTIIHGYCCSKHEKLNDLSQQQENLILNQREHLKKISSLSETLLKLNNQENKLLQQIQSLMLESDKILEESNQISQEIQKKPIEKPPSTASTATELLHYVEMIQNLIFKIADQCTDQNDYILSKQDFARLILEINDIINEAIISGTITESLQGKISRQQSVLDALFSLH